MNVAKGIEKNAPQNPNIPPNIKTASIGDLKKVPNIGTKMARKLYYEFNKNV